MKKILILLQNSQYLEEHQLMKHMQKLKQQPAAETKTKQKPCKLFYAFHSLNHCFISSKRKFVLPIFLIQN